MGVVSDDFRKEMECVLKGLGRINVCVSLGCHDVGVTVIGVVTVL